MADKERASTPGFKLAMVFVFIITVLTLIGMFYLAGFQELTKSQNKLFEICRTAFEGGFGALVGLVAGNRLS